MEHDMREPAVAGLFYPKEAAELDKELTHFFSSVEARHRAVAGISPHAGYEYSGQTAAWTYANLMEGKPIVIMGPDHTGSSLGDTCIYFDGGWKTPLGVVEIDYTIAEGLRDIGILNKAAHNGEHSIEVQLPFIQRRFPGSKIVPIMMGDQNEDVAVAIGKKLAEFDCIVVASSDMSHYVPLEKAEDDDIYAIGALKRLDVDGFYGRVTERQLSACGVGPIAAAATFAKEKGAKRGVLLDYSTSADVTGEEECVGYASMVFL